MFGFSLFGKNLMNIWAIFLGVFLYAKYHKMHLSNYIYVGIYGTSLSPIITQLMHVVELPIWQRFCVTILVGNLYRIRASTARDAFPLCP